MIPKIIHYCWFGRGEMSDLVMRCIASWHKFMPDWDYQLWNEDNFDITSAPLYVRQAYDAKKYAFVSDYVRLWALNSVGGIYLDTDVEVIKPLEFFLSYESFCGFEYSKSNTIGTAVLGCSKNSHIWNDFMNIYNKAIFKTDDDDYDLTPNTTRLSRFLKSKGLVLNGEEQKIDNIHVFSADFFSPLTSTRVLRQTPNTYTIHWYDGSWQSNSFRDIIICHARKLFGNEFINELVTMKRKLRHK